jgi:anaerobic magnesium-protoporphyrin IX monomethyl ester cyclase
MASMDKILFSHSYFMRFDPKQWETGQPYPPLATIGAAALLRENNFRVSLFDTMFVESPEAVIPRLTMERPDFFVLYDDGFNYLTKMCLTNMREAAFRMIHLARSQGCVVIVSSSDSTDHYQEYLEKGADFVLLGEGEQTLLELVNSIRNGSSGVNALRSGLTAPLISGSEQPGFAAIEGLAFLQNKLPLKTASRKVMKDLDSLPVAAWDLVDIPSYRDKWMKQHGYFSLNIGTTRGCPFKCNWCAKPIYGNRYHARTPQHVVKELKMLKERYQFDHIWFCDDIFGLRPGWVSEFADEVAAAQLHFTFKIQSRADLLLQENYVAALARAGCENSWMGAESGSQKILDAMDKGTTVEQIAAATRLLRHHGIRPSFFIQFGYPGETKDDIALTIRMINTLLPDSLGISVSYPLPGTVFYEKVKADLSGGKTNWTDSDELKIMFRNTYPPAFYKQLHRYVHKSYRWHLGLQQIRNLFTRPAAMTKAGLHRAASMVWYLPAAFFAKMKLNKLERQHL